MWFEYSLKIILIVPDYIFQIRLSITPTFAKSQSKCRLKALSLDLREFICA